MLDTQFRQIYADYQGMVRTILFRTCGSQDLDDLVQETFVKVARGIDSFQGKSKLKTWIYQIALNTGRDYLRSKKRRSWLSFWGANPGKETLTDGFKDQEEQRAIERFQSGMEEVQRWEAFHDAERMLSVLSPKLRETMVLYSIEDLSIDEIAQILEIPEGTVKSRINAARTILIEQMQDSNKKEEGK
jgi:RNA polymerase sigma-70 factor, ECF subfamily